MRILFIVAALFVLTGCETLGPSSVSVGVSNGYHGNFISYRLGFYTGHHYNGYSVYGDYGHRYYYAPHNYIHHHYYSAPPVVHYYIQPHRNPPRNHYSDHRNDRDHGNNNRRNHRERRNHRK